MVYKLKCKDMTKILGFLSEVEDEYKEWYITVNNKRVFITDPKILSSYFRKIKRGEIVLGNYEEDGFIFTWGLADKAYRKYIKIVSDNPSIALQMLQSFLDKHGKQNWYTKIKKDNPLKAVFLYRGFTFKGGRGKEILLAREVV